jgi:hypothetical protein
VDARWDRGAIRDRVLQSQRDRHASHQAVNHESAPTSWDYTPHSDSANSYVRNHQDVVDAALSSRLPLPGDST